MSASMIDQWLEDLLHFYEDFKCEYNDYGIKAEALRKYRTRERGQYTRPSGFIYELPSGEDFYIHLTPDTMSAALKELAADD